MSTKLIKHYEGASATVAWDKKLCLHVAECGRATGDLFETGRDPWCQPDTATDADVRNVVERCPSGALSVNFSDPVNNETAENVNTITITYSGPLFLKGQLEIDGAPDDAPGLAFRAALCRCGQSANKPWCDNSHVKAGFSDYGSVGDTGELGELEQVGGPMKVRFRADGPIVVAGNITIQAGSGRVAWQGTQTALCRCGLSSNKPFCDGTHRKEGWTAD